MVTIDILGDDNMSYLDYIYEIVKQESEGLDAIYKDYIINLIGEHGFNTLLEDKLLEGCGSINMRPLYVLCEKKE